MLSAIRDLGILALEQRGITDPLSPQAMLAALVENPKSKSYTHACVIEIDVLDGEVKLKGVKLEQISDRESSRYLYSRGSSRGANLSPSAKITKDRKKFKTRTTFEAKLLGWFRAVTSNVDELGLTPNEQEFLKRLKAFLEREQDEVLHEIEEKLRFLSGQESALLTISVNGDYPGDNDLFRRILVGFQNLNERRIGAEDKVCSICGERKEFVSGSNSTYKFYTTDKPGFIAGGFDEKLSWRNFPVCRECGVYLRAGRRYVEDTFEFRFVAGIGYYLIPRLLLGTHRIPADVRDILIEGPKKISLAGRVVKRLTEDQNEILEIISRQDDILCVQLLFLRIERNAERILLLVEDVYPSMLKEIFAAKEATDQTWGFTKRRFTLGSLRTFFSKSDEKKAQTDLDVYFLQLVEDIFRLRPVDKGFMFRFIAKKIRQDFVNWAQDPDAFKEFRSTVLDGFLSVTFLQKLGLISFMEVDRLPQSLFDRFFEELTPTLSRPAARGILLLGALTGMLLEKQEKERDGKCPFLKQLRGLRLTERDIRGLLPKVENKLVEYDSFHEGERRLAEETAIYLLAAGDNWGLNGDEISFYFAAGMNLSRRIGRLLPSDKNEQSVQEEQGK